MDLVLLPWSGYLSASCTPISLWPIVSNQLSPHETHPFFSLPPHLFSPPHSGLPWSTSRCRLLQAIPLKGVKPEISSELMSSLRRGIHRSEGSSRCLRNLVSFRFRRFSGCEAGFIIFGWFAIRSSKPRRIVSPRNIVSSDRYLNKPPVESLSDDIFTFVPRCSFLSFPSDLLYIHFEIFHGHLSSNPALVFPLWTDGGVILISPTRFYYSFSVFFFFFSLFFLLWTSSARFPHGCFGGNISVERIAPT